ncbi:hypothetical protein BTUL_0190g00030 [Botrytis tulipae]|uniref:Uncharacterized protein n=1 Tax=Botrytis tulipae TaxID=87230 RepID=A0A4Z1EBM7_9HELO|nr:hypothetical protein BTUL_0190g00030 [Botrytis tulipae]
MKKEFYKCLNITKKDSEAKHAVFIAIAARSKYSQKDIELATNLVDERSRYLGQLARNNARWKNNVTGTTAFARFLKAASDSLTVCCVLNTIVIERFERIENHQQGVVRFAGPTTADIKRA